MKNKIIALVFLLLIFGNLAYAQEAKIKLTHVGYGKTAREAYFTIHNTGDVTITNISTFIDGKKYKEFDSVIPPKQGIQTVFYLEPGEHLIEARTPEGAYDSVKITVSSLLEKPYTPPEENKSFLEENIMIIGLVALIIIIVIIAWLFTKKPKLKL